MKLKHFPYQSLRPKAQLHMYEQLKINIYLNAIDEFISEDKRDSMKLDTPSDDNEFLFLCMRGGLRKNCASAFIGIILAL